MSRYYFDHTFDLPSSANVTGQDFMQVLRIARTFRSTTSSGRIRIVLELDSAREFNSAKTTLFTYLTQTKGLTTPSRDFSRSGMAWRLVQPRAEEVSVWNPAASSQPSRRPATPQRSQQGTPPPPTYQQALHEPAVAPESLYTPPVHHRPLNVHTSLDFYHGQPYVYVHDGWRPKPPPGFSPNVMYVESYRWTILTGVRRLQFDPEVGWVILSA